MTHPNHDTNGASLEDCHTNFYALTDLCGIKWRKLVWGELNYNPPNILDDPVLSSYSRCLMNDVLCVWRRIGSHSQQPTPNSASVHTAAGLFDSLGALATSMSAPPAPTLSLTTAKELWIFWYGEEPDLSGLISPQLLTSGDGEQGSWESGLSYECRSLLFKALHNLIERCLLSRDFVRLGKWFVQPYDGSKKLIENSSHLSISFSFFVHGESTVCISIDVRQHPPVRTLVKEHLEQMQSCPHSAPPVQVILAPFGLTGTLTGQSFKVSDMQTQKLLEDWRCFYPLNFSNSSCGVDPIVEVVVSGIKLRYPSCYILVTDLDESTANFYGTSAPPSRNNNQPVSGVPVTVVPLHQHHPESMAHPSSPATVLPERAWQDCIVNLPETPPVSPCQSSNNSDSSQNVESSFTLGNWNFHDPHKKYSCTCFKSTSNSRQQPQQQSCNNASQQQNVTLNSGNNSNSVNDTISLPLNTPPSITPSPLTNPNSCQPPSVTTLCDPTMPTLSPQHPPSLAPPSTPYDDKIPRTPSEFQGGPKSASSMINPVYSPYSCVSSMDNINNGNNAANNGNSNNSNNNNNNINNSSNSSCGSNDDNGNNNNNNNNNSSSSSNNSNNNKMAENNTSSNKPIQSMNMLSSQTASSNLVNMNESTNVIVLKRPKLSAKEYDVVKMEEESQPSQLLYDYSLMDAWLNHPVKRYKAAEPKINPPTRGPSCSMWSTSGTNTQSVSSPPEQIFIKQEITDSKPACAIEKKSMDQVIVNGPKSAPNNLFTNEGLTASYKDLDQIFENSDDASSDEATLQVQTPPGSNKPAGYSDECNSYNSSTTTILVRPPRSSGGNGTGLRPEELSKMFPTPPSLEHNPISSPYGGHSSDTPICETLDYLVPLTNTRIKQEVVTSISSPQNEPNDDWSYVYRPPTCAMMIGSHKYTPLSNLPSQNLPPVSLPSDLVYKPSYYYSQHNEKPQIMTGNTRAITPSSSGPNIMASINNGHHTISSPLRPPSNPMMMHQPPHHHPHTLSSPAHNHHPLMPLHSSGPPIHGIHPSPPRMGLPPISPGPYPPSPMMNWQQQSYRAPGGIRAQPCQPPPPYSPVNSAAASSYLNKNMNPASVEPMSTGNNLGPGMVRSQEANSLVINILLSDTLLNIFRDHNFDSCTLCVCNNGPKVVGNIKGADAATYLPPAPQSAPPSANSALSGSISSPYAPYSPAPTPHHFVDEDSIRCNCGFSAVVNRKLSHRAGLFYEDESEITGLYDEPLEKDELNGAAIGVIDIVREQCVIIHSSCNALYRAARQYKPQTPPPTLNLLEFSDSNQVVMIALEQGRLAHIEAATVSMCKVEEVAARQQMIQQHCASSNGIVNGRPYCVHRWPFMKAKGPRCNQDIMRVMKILQPLLQDSIQRRYSNRMWDATYTVSGPLTWRQFHRLAGRGTDDRCEPQPIPPILVGHDKDWISVSPYALHYWEKMMLEPFSYCRDIAYIVVSPDNEFILQKVRTFFKELSSSYEVCRLGRHCPITKVLRDGILRVGKTAAVKLAKESADEWFNTYSENTTTATLRLYSQVCRHYLSPQLSQFTIDSSLLDPPEPNVPRTTITADVTRPSPSPMPPPSSNTPDNIGNNVQSNVDKPPSTPKSEQQDENSRNDSFNSSSTGDLAYHDEDDNHPPAIVIYLVEPFSVGTDDTELHRLTCVALLRSYKNILNTLPENVRNNIIVQVISLESILELGRSGDRNRHSDEIRALALSVYSQCRRLLTHSANVKALTGFGTAAMTDIFLKNKDEKNKAPYRAYCPPYILAKNKEKLKSSSESSAADCTAGSGNNGTLVDQQCTILYVSYCLSEDQKWILVTATDEHGVISDSATINIHVPNRNRRRKASARRIGLQKVMDFILGVMSQSVTPWRLVVGRVGRLGHGELKGWSWLLCRKSLIRASKHLKEICGQCNLLYPTDVPCILSACLVSLEADSTLRVMPDQFTPDERFSQASVNCHLSTPHDVTCTHILVFPTSATTQSSQTAFQEQQNNGTDLDDADLLNALNDDMPEGMGDLNDIFSNWQENDVIGSRSPIGSPRGRENSHPSSPSCTLGDPSDQRSPFQCNGGPLRIGANGVDMQEEVGSLLQQPLALGYLVSTAPTGRMPRWFWSSCPHLENVCPAFLKSALHMHTTQQNGDELLQQSSVSGHPLDSQYTTDVLRYVLEGYNTLSWLAIDSNTHDRLSCLPVHMQILMQLYHMMSALI